MWARSYPWGTGVLLLALAAACSAPGAAAAAEIPVTTAADTTANDGQCSLREAISSANNTIASPGCATGGGTDLILVPAGTYTLGGSANEDLNGGGDLDIRSNLTLDGAGAGSTVINGASIDRVIDVRPDSVASIEGVTVTGGRTANGANGANVTGVGANGIGGAGGPAQGGGGIRNEGTLTLANSVVTLNRTGDGGDGGNGVGGESTAPLGTGFLGGGGSGGPGGPGGGIQSLGSNVTLTVVNSTISGNETGKGGKGGDGTGGTSGPGGVGGGGAGNFGGSGGEGGGIATSGGLLTVANSTISGNSSGGGGASGHGVGGNGRNSLDTVNGGTGGNAQSPQGGNGGTGAGIAVFGTGTVSGSTIVGNRTGTGGLGGTARGGHGGSAQGSDTSADGGSGGRGQGGPGGPGGLAAGAFGTTELSFVNSTVSGNTPGDGGLGGDGYGGDGGTGAFSSGVAEAGNGGNGGSAFSGRGGNAGQRAVRVGGTLLLKHATVTDTKAAVAAAAGNAFAGAAGGGGFRIGGCDPPGGNDPCGVDGTPGTATQAQPGTPASAAIHVGASMTMTNSIVASNATGNCEGTVTDGGTNISFGDTTCPGSNADPLLGPLANNGGPTRTHALGAGSPAIDAVPASGAGCEATDQRGIARPQGGACDIGAFEVAPPGTPGMPGGDPGPAGGTPSDTIIPVVGRTTVTNRIFAVDRRGTAETPVAAAAKKGTTFRFTLSEEARVVFTIERATIGRKVGRRCRRQTRSNRRRPRCTRYVSPLRFAVQGSAGANRKKFSGKIGRRSLRPGNYRATLVATDAAGNRSAPRRVTFKVVRR